MTNILFFIAGIALGFYIKGKMGEKTGKSFKSLETEELGEIMEKAREALSERTEERKEKILEFMRREGSFDEALKTCKIEEGENKPGATCNEIEKLLKVSGKTARKYLDELEDENKIRQVGKTGRGIYYVLN